MKNKPMQGVVYYFFLDKLDDYVKSTYRIICDEKTQNYYMYHKEFKQNNVFTIVRTSKRCYRVTHFNNQSHDFLYFSCKNYRLLARKINAIVWRYVIDDYFLRPP